MAKVKTLTKEKLEQIQKEKQKLVKSKQMIKK